MCTEAVAAPVLCAGSGSRVSSSISLTPPASLASWDGSSCSLTDPAPDFLELGGLPLSDPAPDSLELGGPLLSDAAGELSEV